MNKTIIRKNIITIEVFGLPYSGKTTGIRFLIESIKTDFPDTPLFIFNEFGKLNLYVPYQYSHFNSYMLQNDYYEDLVSLNISEALALRQKKSWAKRIALNDILRGMYYVNCSKYTDFLFTLDVCELFAKYIEINDKYTGPIVIVFERGPADAMACLHAMEIYNKKDAGFPRSIFTEVIKSRIIDTHKYLELVDAFIFYSLSLNEAKKRRKIFKGSSTGNLINREVYPCLIKGYAKNYEYLQKYSTESGKALIHIDGHEEVPIKNNKFLKFVKEQIACRI